MARNNGPGGKNRRKGKNVSSTHKREIRYKEEYEEYGIVEKMLGDSRTAVECTDGVNRVCHIRGKFRKRVWITPGDIVLVSLREFQDDKADIVHKYNPDEILVLKQQKHIQFGGESEPGSEDEAPVDLFVAEDTASQDPVVIDDI